MVGHWLAGACTAVLAYVKVRDAVRDPRFFWTSMVLVIGLLLAGLLLGLLKWWQQSSPPEPPRAGDELAHFRELYERGELSPEEFERIRQRLGTRLKQELDVAPAAPPAAAAEEPKPPEPPTPPAAAG